MCCQLTNQARRSFTKYKPFPKINLPDRQWPSKQITKAPRWLATDLRDGNQSLPDPMNVDEKKEFFTKLVNMGYKEIEVAFPSASQVDFDFTRFAVETAPSDVAIQVLSPCREELIRRTVESLKGAKRAIVHIYVATSPLFRDVVFGFSEEETKRLAVRSTKLVRELTKDNPDAQDTEWQFEFSPETFSDTPLDYTLSVLEAVKKEWAPTAENPIIFNLPATVEVATPNIYADQIEYISRNLSEREKCHLSLHCHNDRGTAVAATELGLMAGADRVEGCLFGNGERTGNVDLVTLGLNLYTQGIDPKIDFSDLEVIVELVERLNKLPVHPRAPYGGNLVVCAFSGSHQDAIKKGFSRWNSAIERNGGTEENLRWQLPYLPLDPSDVGRTYEAVIRVNSQSGKGGAAWMILRHLELDLPRGLQVSFSKHVQAEAEFKDRELRSNELVELFSDLYILQEGKKRKYDLIDFDVANIDSTQRKFTGELLVNDEKVVKLEGYGNGPISSFLNAIEASLGYDLDVENYHEHSIGKGSKTRAASFIEVSTEVDGKEIRDWGIGIHEDVSKASLHALLAVLNRLDPLKN